MSTAGCPSARASCPPRFPLCSLWSSLRLSSFRGWDCHRDNNAPVVLDLRNILCLISYGLPLECPSVHQALVRGLGKICDAGLRTEDISQVPVVAVDSSPAPNDTIQPPKSADKGEAILVIRSPVKLRLFERPTYYASGSWAMFITGTPLSSSVAGAYVR